MGKKIVVGVIGSGRIGKLHIENIVRRIPDVVVKAVADINRTGKRGSRLRTWLANSRPLIPGICTSVNSSATADRCCS